MPGAVQRYETAPVDSVTLADVLATDALAQRQTRQPDFPAEIAALHALAQRLVDDPDTMLDSLMAIALQLCDAGTAGLSLLEQPSSDEVIFRWAAMAGPLSTHVGGSTPRDFSPCGVCTDRGTPQLFTYPERYFTYFQAARPTIVEGLVIPIQWNGDVLGTIWIASHDESRRFDREDVRVMESLAGFTAAALCVLQLRRAGEEHREQLEARVAERTAALSDSHARLEHALAECRSHEAARSDWLRTLMNAQEDERGRVARELHDEMGQHLNALRFGLQTVLQGSEDDRESTRGRLQDAVGRIDRGVHRLSRALRPSELDDLGLVSALTAFAGEWQRGSGIACEFSHHNCGARLPAPIETTVYRITQEALTNVARHARAAHASVVLNRGAGGLRLIVEDDGIGIDAAPRGEGSRYGLVGIRERAALLGGSVSLESSAGGTTLYVTVPLGAAADG